MFDFSEGVSIAYCSVDKMSMLTESSMGDGSCCIFNIHITIVRALLRLGRERIVILHSERTSRRSETRESSEEPS